MSRLPGHLEPGSSTAVGTNVTYRLGKIRERGLLGGLWLDCGCADGGYTDALRDAGAAGVVGVELVAERLEAGRRRGHPVGTAFSQASTEGLPFRDQAFDGVLLNEVLEHVGDEQATLREIRRVLKPGGALVLMSPNRYFPFEGHGMKIGRFSVRFPVPLLPWLPSPLTMKVMTARNYWPKELENLVRTQQFDVLATSSVLPVMEVYPWLPPRTINWYRSVMPTIERTPILRRFGVSTLIVAQRPNVAE